MAGMIHVFSHLSVSHKCLFEMYMYQCLNFKFLFLTIVLFSVLTTTALRRRGYTAKSLNLFCKVLGVTKNASTTPLNKLERCIRQELENKAKRVYAVVNPLKVSILLK